LASLKKSPGRPREFDREIVLEKAMQAFFQHGFDGTTARDLQAATGLSAPSFYNAFGSKHDVFLAALELYARSGFAYMIDELAAGTGGLDDLVRFLEKVWSTFEGQNSPMGCMVLNTRGEFGQSQPDILAICNMFTDRQVAAITAALQRAAGLGEIDPNLVARHGRCFRMMLNGFLHLVRSNGLDGDVKAAFAALRQTVRAWQPGVA
jgi:TetR/AcrR family transcriptional repressor of nem operon